ncbi:ABC transporter permease [Celeribacter sp. PS-C1]|uniref:ABC transporter permease n=1 Tax=Celeribacter sp. PS-C1 TaxID=2820813 RepID=UPI001CA52238|nr:ABC transporter permease [Celeribacter sp. PS-C1]MBW6416195.1 ABC transporter permease [Celeribacter sp. PS-C1]
MAEYDDAPEWTGRKDRRFRTLRAISALTIRELATSSSRTTGGYAWTLAEPIAGIAVMSVIFSLILRSPPLGTNFQIFYATGFLVFNFYRDMAGRVTNAVRSSRALLQYPSITYVDAVIAKALASMVTQTIIMFVVLTGITMFWETRTELHAALAVVAVTGAVVLGIGVGLINALIIAYLPMWQHVWTVLNRPLVLISGVIYLHDRVPQPYQDYLWWNPVVHIVGQMRRAFYPQYTGDYVTMSYPIGLGLVLIAIGLALLNRFNRDILTRL